MKRVLIGALLASVVMFVWGFLFWGISPVPKRFMKSVPDETGLAQKLQEALPETGLYILPNMGPGVSQEEFMRRHLAGPLAQITFVRQGTNPMGGGTMGGGWLHMFGAAVLMGLLLLQVPGAPTAYQRFCILALVAAVAAYWTNLGKPIWWHQPWDFHVLYAVYDLTSLLIAAAILGWYVKKA